MTVIVLMMMMTTTTLRSHRDVYPYVHKSSRAGVAWDPFTKHLMMVQPLANNIITVIVIFTDAGQEAKGRHLLPAKLHRLASTVVSVALLALVQSVVALV